MTTGDIRTKGFGEWETEGVDAINISKASCKKLLLIFYLPCEEDDRDLLTTSSVEDTHWYLAHQRLTVSPALARNHQRGIGKEGVEAYSI